MKKTMKKVLLTTITPIVSLATIAIPLTSCSCNSTKKDDIVIDGKATYDKEQTKIKLDTTSTILLKPETGYAISFIQSVQVGNKIIATTSYSFNKITNILTIKGIAMQSTKIKIKLLTEPVEEEKDVYSLEPIYTGQRTAGSYLNTYTLSVDALFTDQTTKTLTIDTEYKVFIDEQDITSQIKDYPGYKFSEVKTYYLTIKAGKNFNKVKEIAINIQEKPDPGPTPPTPGVEISKITDVEYKGNDNAGDYMFASDFVVTVEYSDGTTGTVDIGTSTCKVVVVGTDITKNLASAKGEVKYPGNYEFTFKTGTNFGITFNKTIEFIQYYSATSDGYISMTTAGMNLTGSVIIPEYALPDDSGTPILVKGVALSGCRECKASKITFAKPDNIVGFADGAFYQAINLKSFTIPNNVVAIGKAAFEYCDQLSTVEFKAITEWSQVGGSAIEIGTTETGMEQNATNLKDTTGTSPTGTNWGKTGIQRSLFKMEHETVEGRGDTFTFDEATQKWGHPSGPYLIAAIKFTFTIVGDFDITFNYEKTGGFCSYISDLNKTVSDPVVAQLENVSGSYTFSHVTTGIYTVIVEHNGSRTGWAAKNEFVFSIAVTKNK